AVGGQHAVACHGLVHHAFAFADGQIGIGLIGQAADFAPFVVVAYPAFERAEAAGAGMPEGVTQGGDVDGFGGEREARHPPATGGMKTMVSPSSTALPQSLKRTFTATL